MKRILVTGGAGFIGSHLCNKLITLGYYVICLDNFFTGSRNNVKHLISHPNFELVEHDVIEPYDAAKVDQIYSLACPASPIHYQHDPIKTIKASIFGTINMLETAKKYDAKILLASTSEIYGDPIIHPQLETYWGNVNPIGVRSCYDEGKRCAETLCMDFNRQHNVKIKIVRIFNTYGPNMHPNDGRVVSNFIVQALQDKDITIYGNGLQTRSFQYIDNLIDGLVNMMESGDEFIGPVNLGNPNELTVEYLANTIISMTNSKSKIVFEPLPSDDPQQRQPNIGLARQMLNYDPNIDIKQGLSRTIEYFEKLLNREIK